MTPPLDPIGPIGPIDPILKSGVDEFRDYVNAIAVERATLSGAPTRWVRVAPDGALIDADGKRWYDFLSGYGTQALGHRNRAVARALRAFLDGDSPSFFTSGVSPYAGRVARVLCERTGYDNAFLASGGSEAVEAAIKLARAATGRPRILCLSGAYHGCTLGSLAMMAPGPFRDPFGPHLPGVEAVPLGDVHALDAALTDDVAAVVVEPIQVEGGVCALPDDFIAVLCELAPARGALVVADEIQTGLGRVGQFLATETWPRRPDVVTLGKFLGGGLVPCSATLSRQAPFEAAYGTIATAEAHNTTFGGNALACVAALAALEQIDDALLARVREVGAALHRALTEALAELPLVAEIRGRGLLAGIALRDADHPWLSFESMGLPELGDRPAVGLLLCHRLFRRGFLCHVSGHDWRVVRVQPRLDVTPELVAAFADACTQEVQFLCDLT